MAALLDAAYQQLGVPIEPRHEAPTRLNLIANAVPAPFAAAMALPPPPPHRYPARIKHVAKPTARVVSGHGKAAAGGKIIRLLPRGGREARRVLNDAG
jgi:hypothetical protein